MKLFLHRDDLRIHDNNALFRASQDKALPLYLDDPRIRERTGLNKKAFREQGLKRLTEKYREKGSGVLIRKGKTAEEIKKIIDEREVEAVYYNRSYTPLKRRIEKQIQDLEVETKSFKDRLIVEPRQLDQEYGTFSPFYRDWKKFEKEEPFPGPENLADVETELPTLDADASADIPEAGEDVALQKWKDFRDERLENYKDKRDEVAEPESVSRLSMYYSSGMLGIRKVISDVEQMIESSEDSDKIRNYAKYRNELAWREFFYQVLYFNPNAVDKNYKEFENEIEWRNDSEEFEAWKKGETGVPFVDAGIRELRQSGYMHNRTRQNVASFLTKHLMVDWRKGAAFFRRHLVDHDTASNTGGWQWAASTGTDSVPIRIFNPVKQGRKYDPEAEYIKRWIPELRPLEPEKIHNWVKMSSDKRDRFDTAYSEPIINFNQRYHSGKKMFERALGR